jgi:tRNA (guanine37-N1)-methyltransferase
VRFDIITLFPPIFAGYLTQSLLAKAIDRGLVEIHIHDLREWSTDTKHHKIDDKPYGGGPGMLICVDPVVHCVEAVQQMAEKKGVVVMMTPQGDRLDQRRVEEIARFERMILLCGRYEGFDQRVIDILNPLELSVGDYVLNGGEVASMVVVDSTVRMIPGVLGDEQSSWDDSFSRGNRLLEFPQYTRPAEFRGHTVPDVLLSGDHKRIANWRAEQSLNKTKIRRNDLFKKEGES